LYFSCPVSRESGCERCCVIEVHGKRDAVRFIETRCGERAPIYVPDPARKRSEESFDTENKGSFLSLFLSVVDDAMVYPCAHREPVGEKERKTQAEREKERERECATCVAAGVRLIVVSNRLYPGILIHSQLSALVAARDEQNVVRIYCEKQDSNGERIRDESPIPRCTSTIR